MNYKTHIQSKNKRRISHEIQNSVWRIPQSRSAIAKPVIATEMRNMNNKNNKQSFLGDLIMNRKSIFLIGVLLMLSATAQVFAAGTAAGTVITNVAYGGYSDANGNLIADVDGASAVTAQAETEVIQVYGVEVLDTDSNDIPRNGTIIYGMTVENTGNGEDSYDLDESTSSTGSSTFTVTIYEDTNEDGVLDAGEVSAGAITSISNLAADDKYYIIVQVAVTDGEQGEVATTTITATSQGDGDVDDSKDLTSTVQAALISGTLIVTDESPIPGQTITYTLTFHNSDDGNSATAYSPVVTLPTLPSGYSWGGTVTKDGVGISDPGAGGTISFSNLPADATDHTVTFTVVVNTDASNGATFTADVDIDYNDATTDAYPTRNIEANQVTVNKTSDLSSDIDPASQSGDPGDEIVYKLTVHNDGNGDDSYTLSNFSSSQSWSWDFYVDDGDGVWEDDGSDAEGTTSGTIATGGSKVFWAVTTIPTSGLSDGDSDASVFRFTNASLATTDETGTTTVTMPVLGLSKVVDNPTAIPGDVLTYTITVSNTGSGDATSVVVKDPIPSELTYVDNSMKIDGSAVNDTDNGADGDAHWYNSGVGNGVVIFDIGSMASGASYELSFQATVK